MKFKRVYSYLDYEVQNILLGEFLYLGKIVDTKKTYLNMLNMLDLGAFG